MSHGKQVRDDLRKPTRELRHAIPAVVRRVWTPSDKRCDGIEFVAVRFTRMEKELERELAREVMELQRGSLYKA